RSRRWRIPPARAESRPGAARATRQGRLSWPQPRQLRLRRHGLVPRARTHAWRRASRSGADPPWTASSRARTEAWSADGRDPQGRLRTAARWKSDDRRRGGGACEGAEARLMRDVLAAVLENRVNLLLVAAPATWILAGVMPGSPWIFAAAAMSLIPLAAIIGL